MRGTASLIDQPTGAEPVKDTTGSRGSATSSGMASFGTVSTDHAPSGRSVSASSSASSRQDSGVFGAGLMMMGAPTANAGATLCATRFNGKLNGVIANTGPRGKRLATATRPAPAGSVSSRCSAPDQRRASSAPHRNVEIARATSTRAQVSGLPLSAVMRAASSSPRSAMRPATWASAVARPWAGMAAMASAAAAAAATAASTCAGSGCATMAIRRSSQGCRTGKVAEPVTGRPATQNGSTVLMDATPPPSCTTPGHG